MDQRTGSGQSRIGSLVDTVQPPLKIAKTAFASSGRFPIVDQSQEEVAGWTDDESALIRPSDPLVVFGDHTCSVKLVEIPFAQGADGIKILRTSPGLDPRFLYYVLKSRPLKTEGYQRHFSLLKEMEIPLPPIAIQRQAVAEIEAYRRVADAARAVLRVYGPRVPGSPDWPLVEIGELCTRVQYGLSVPLDKGGIGYRTFRMNEVVNGRCIDGGRMKCADVSQEVFAKYRLDRGDILFNRTNSFDHVGRTGIFDLEGDYCFASYLIRLSVDRDKADPFFINYLMNSDDFQRGIKQYATRAIGQSNINARNLVAYRLPLPSLDTQHALVAAIERDRILVEANSELAERFEDRIEATIARIWGQADAQASQ